jgi:hypothetical protein
MTVEMDRRRIREEGVQVGMHRCHWAGRVGRCYHWEVAHRLGDCCQHFTTHYEKNTNLQIQVGVLSWPAGVLLEETHRAEREVLREVHQGDPSQAAACQEEIPGQAGMAAGLLNKQ